MWQLNNLRLGKSLSSSGFGVTAGNPSLNLNFLGTSTLNPLVTFTRASSGTYFDSTGTLQTAGNNAARFDYNPSTLASRGLFIEEQRTNLCLHSEDFANVAWNKLNATVTSNSSTSPSGTTTADTLSASTSDGVIIQDIIVSTNTNYTFSVFLKSDTTTNLTLFLFTTSFATISSQAITVTNSWQRFTVSGNSGVNATIRVSIGGGSTFSSPEIVYAWGAQLEAGAFATSYIATTTASATRSADVASVNTLSPWYNASAGTLYVEAVRENIPVAANGNILDISDGTTNNRARLWIWSGNASQLAFTVSSGGVTQADINPGNVSANAIFKGCGAYATNNFATVINGGSVVTDLSGAVPVTPNIMNIGSRVGGSELWNGYIRRITYYPRRLSNAALQSLTA